MYVTLSTLNRGILPSATDLESNTTELNLSELDAARNEKRNRMNPSSITQNKAGIPAMPLQLQRSLIVHLYIQLYVYIQQYFTHKRTHLSLTQSLKFDNLFQFF
ncbi:Hypothetical_protein [Hexamita inflata]|uniref:Hypothetical_protein n=1 Tax=Hexamita inflata TaxID=28002 RepID=A0AA86PPX1_9EUKA|nr:Hypothetical protein HINF_LOCUS31176 [Hexamita inflata]